MQSFDVSTTIRHCTSINFTMTPTENVMWVTFEMQNPWIVMLFHIELVPKYKFCRWNDPNKVHLDYLLKYDSIGAQKFPGVSASMWVWQNWMAGKFWKAHPGKILFQFALLLGWVISST